MKRSILALVFLFAFTISLSAQSTIISSEEADELYGPPIETINISVTVLDYFIDNYEYIMFRIRDGKINIFGRERKPIIQEFATNDTDIYFVYESKTLGDLLNIGTDSRSQIELRIAENSSSKDGSIITTGHETITVTNDTSSLVLPFPCPPECFDDDED